MDERDTMEVEDNVSITTDGGTYRLNDGYAEEVHDTCRRRSWRWAGGRRKHGISRSNVSEGFGLLLTSQYCDVNLSGNNDSFSLLHRTLYSILSEIRILSSFSVVALLLPPSDEKNFPPPSITRTHRIVATQTLFPFFHSTILSSSRCIQSLPTTSTTTTWSLNPSQTSTSPSASRQCSWRAPQRKPSFQPYPNDTVAKMAKLGSTTTRPRRVALEDVHRISSGRRAPQRR